MFQENGSQIQVPLISRPRPPTAQLVGELLAKLLAPAADRLIADLYAAQEHHLFDSTEAQGKADVQQHAVSNDLGGRTARRVDNRIVG